MMPVEETSDFIHVRVIDPPDQFETFRLTDFDGKLPKGVQAKYGKYRGRDEWAIQAFLFSKEDGWTREKALDWVDEWKQRGNLRMDAPIGFEAKIEEMDGVWRIPTVFTREGVHNSGYKPREELKKAAPWFNMLPIVCDEHGQMNDLSRAVGFTSDVHYDDSDGAVKGYSNFWPDKLPQDVREALKTGSMRGGSIGYWCKPIPQGGSWNGKPYSEVETEVFPDHYLAPIPDGACSVADRCGLFFNQSSQGERMICEKGLVKKIIDALQTAIQGDASTKDEKRDTSHNSLPHKPDDIAALKAERDALKAQLEKRQQEEQQKTEKLRSQLITEVAAKTGTKPEDYEDWDIPKLERLKAVASGNVDRSLKAPVGSDGFRSGLTVGRWDPVRKEWRTD